jgi:hypothetical protein
MKTPWTKNTESNRIAEVVSQGRGMTWGESFQCLMVQIEVSQCPTGGWRNHQGTEKHEYIIVVLNPSNSPPVKHTPVKRLPPILIVFVFLIFFSGE